MIIYISKFIKLINSLTLFMKIALRFRKISRLNRKMKIRARNKNAR